MDRYKLFLITSTIFLLPIGCSSISQYWKEENERIKKEREVYEKNEKRVTYRCPRELVGGEVVEYVDQSRVGYQLPRDIREDLCVGSQQKIRYEFYVRGIVPPAPKGIPLPDAQRLQSLWRSEMSKQLENFFIVGSYPNEVSPLGRSLECTEYSIGTNDTKEFEKQQLAGEYSLYSAVKESNPPFLYLNFGQRNRFYMVESGVHFRGPWRGNGPRNDYNINPVLNRVGSVRPISIRNILLFVSEKKYRSQYDSKRQEFSLGFGTLGDLAALRKNYVILAPPDTQKEVFGNCLHCIGNGENMSSDISGYVRDQDRDFSTFLKNNTSIEEAQTDHPSIVDFKISLNLEPFCKYGKLATDLLSK